MTVREIRDNELRIYVNSWGKTVKRKLIKTSGDNQVATCFLFLVRENMKNTIAKAFKIGVLQL